MFGDLNSRPRSFFGLHQIRTAQQISSGPLINKQDITTVDIEEANMHLKFDIFDVRCLEAKCGKTRSEIQMNHIQSSLYCEECN